MSAADVGTLVGYGIMPRHVGRGGGLGQSPAVRSRVGYAKAMA